MAMNGTVFFQNDDGVYTPVAHINDADITVEEEPDITVEESDKLMAWPEEITINCDADELLQAILPPGKYNAYVLKRDGYLSEKNGRCIHAQKEESDD